MKRSAQNSSTLSLVPAEFGPDDSYQEEKAANLKESFDNWLDSMFPTLLRSTVAEETPNATRWRRTLTSTDIMRVNRATVSESTDHRHWPPEVVISFLSADVIKRKQR